jgi:hypothetical protein
MSRSASITSQSGGTCVCPPDSPDLCDSDPAYMLCVQEINRDLVTATAAIAALTSFCMGLFANMPIALAPGMGLNAYFAYTVVGYVAPAWCAVTRGADDHLQLPRFRAGAIRDCSDGRFCGRLRMSCSLPWS